MTTLLLIPVLAVTLEVATDSHNGLSTKARAVPVADPDLLEPEAATSKAGPTPTAAGATPTPGCLGPPLTSQSQVRPNSSYCGGHATSRIVLAAGDTWTGGEVSGAVTGIQQGAVQCGDPCTLVDMYVHDNPLSFAGIAAGAGTITGGRVTGSGSEGIAGGSVDGLIVAGVEIDHNGATAKCGFEGGGFKAGAGIHQHLVDNYIHDNDCSGIWYDINSANNEIDHNRIIDNAAEGIFYEISQNAVIHNNDVEGNGFRTDGKGCVWLWGGGITIASSFDIRIYSNILKGNCNGITGTQQNRADSAPPAHLLKNLSVSSNIITGGGRVGVAADNGDDLTTRNIAFADNRYGGGTVLCSFAC